MPKTRMMGAGYAGASKYYNAGMSGGINAPQGGGSKLQGLAPTTGVPVKFALRNIRRRAHGDSRHTVFCMNQIGGIGAVGAGNRSRTFASTADGVKDCVPGDYPTRVAFALDTVGKLRKDMKTTTQTVVKAAKKKQPDTNDKIANKATESAKKVTKQAKNSQAAAKKIIKEAEKTQRDAKEQIASMNKEIRTSKAIVAKAEQEAKEATAKLQKLQEAEKAATDKAAEKAAAEKVATEKAATEKAAADRAAADRAAADNAAEKAAEKAAADRAAADRAAADRAADRAADISNLIARLSGTY